MSAPSVTVLIRSVAVLLCLYAYSTGSRAANPEQQGDPQLAAQVKAALTQDHLLYSAHIEVRAEPGGIVHLAGIVASDDDLNLARRDAKAVAGVQKVIDDLHIEGYAGR